MKKTYIKPEMEVTALGSMDIICLSNGYTTNATSGNLANDRYDFDDDEDLGSIIPW